MLRRRRIEWPEWLGSLAGAEPWIRVGVVAFAVVPAVLTKAYAAARGLQLAYQLALTISAGVCVLSLGLAAVALVVPRLPRAQRDGFPADVPPLGPATVASAPDGRAVARAADIGAWEQSIGTSSPGARFNGLTWTVIGVDVFSRSVCVRVLLRGRGLSTHITPFLDALAVVGAGGEQLRPMGSTAANAFAHSARNVLLLSWFRRQNSKALDALAIACGPERVDVIRPALPAAGAQPAEVSGQSAAPEAVDSRDSVTGDRDASVESTEFSEPSARD